MVGQGTYGGIYVLNHNTGSKLSIGLFCSIALEAVFVLNSNHNMKTISTFPYKVKLLKNEHYKVVTKGDIIVENDVWIGIRLIILSGVHTGQGAVVAAGSVITKDVPPYAIVAGNPAKIVRKRFSNEIISKLLTLDYDKLDISNIQRNHKWLYQEVNEENVDKILYALIDK